jgi:hypothetical protein
MSELASQILEKIEAAKEYEDIKYWIWMACELIRRGVNPDYQGGLEETDREIVTENEAKELKEAALRALPRNSDPYWIGSFLSMLRYTCDADLKPLWIEYLERHLGLLKRSNAIVHTVLIALWEMDEIDRQAPGGGRSMADVDLNIAEAQDYLQKHEIKVPW